MSMPIARDDLRRRILGCWLGKAVGGTLGGPLEGNGGPHDLRGYDPQPTTLMPNDDLDLQVVWACLLAQARQPVLDAALLKRGWLDHIGFRMDEYGVCVRNLQAGLLPPRCGAYDNWFVDGMGAAIRSELWACLAPGDPDTAAAMARLDASFDHAGDGVDAEVFLAALEAQAFVDQDLDRLLDCGLARIPAGGRLHRAIRDTRRWWRADPSWTRVRARILDHHGHENFTDCVHNIAITVLGLLAGGGDFGRTVCTAVNCGQDSDCTGATAGAIMGILAPDRIGDEWLQPIGRQLVLSPPITGLDAPATIDGFADLVLGLSGRVRLDATPAAEPAQPEPFAMTLSAQDLPWHGGWGTGVPHWWQVRPREIDTAGTWVRLPITAWRDEALLLRWRFRLSAKRHVNAMVATALPMRFWIDGAFAGGRDGGLIAPTPHRGTHGQHAWRELDAGEHELTFLLRKPLTGYGEFGVAIADAAKQNEWIVEAHRPPKAAQAAR